MAAHRFTKADPHVDPLFCLACGEINPAGDCPGDRRHAAGDEIISGGFYACARCGLVLDGDEDPNCPVR